VGGKRLLVRVPNVLLVNAALGITTVPELIALLRSQGGLPG
jgi:hypothetical protein